MPNRSSLRALIALLLALALLAAACGGSDDDDSSEASTDDSTAQDDSTSDDSSSDDSSGDDGAEDDTPADEPDDEPADEPADDSDDAPTPTGDAAVFCARYAENEALFDDLDPFDPEQVESWINQSRSLLAEAIGDAPGELVPDLQIIQTDFDALASLLEDAGYDFLAVSEEDITAAESPDSQAASDRLDAWIDANCPEGTGDDESSLTDDFTTPEGLEAILGSEAGRELFIDGFVDSSGLTRDQAVCVIDNLDVDMMSRLATDPGAIDPQGAVDLLDVFSTCGIDITQLAG